MMGGRQWNQIAARQWLEDRSTTEDLPAQEEGHRCLRYASKETASKGHGSLWRIAGVIQDLQIGGFYCGGVLALEKYLA